MFGHDQLLHFFRRLTPALHTALCVFAVATHAQAAGVLIPLPDPERADLKAPAVDLTDDAGRPLDRDEVVDLIHSGKDTSLLNPFSSDVWSPSPLPVGADVSRSPPNYPPEGATVLYDSDLPSSSGMLRARVSGSDGTPYRAVLSLDVHGALARSALLRKLGYRVDAPKHYESLTLRFPSVEKRTEFLNALSNQTLSDRSRWVLSLSDIAPEVTLQDLALEPGRIQTAPYHWGAMAASHLQNRRILRALIIPFVLLDLSAESINLYSWEIGKILSGNVSLTHPYGDAFSEITYEDARWIARRITRLTRADFQEITRASRFPEPVAAIVLEKLLARRNQLVALFDLKKELSHDFEKIKIHPKISMEPGLVKGKIRQERFPGHAERFTFGDPKSPLNKEEIARYLLQETLASGMTAAAAKLNELLTIRGATDVTQAHQQELFKAFLKHVKNNPRAPFERPLAAWIGPTGNFEVNASRNLITGSYYGSDSMLQLIDNIGASASVGFFVGVDGLLTQGLPSARGNLSIQRNYLHIRPVADTNAALKTSWAWLWAPGFMKHLGKFLEPEECSLWVIGCKPVLPSEKLDAAAVSKNVDQLFSELKEGEILMITDTISSGAGASLTLPVSALVNADLSGTTGSFSFGIQGQAQVLRKTTISRTQEGLQVYIQHANIESLGIAFDFNFWMKVFRASYHLRRGAADVRAYLVGNKPDDEAGQRKLLIAMNGLLKGNNSELLESSYPHYALNHRMPSNAWRAHFLPWSWTALEEGHRLRILPPADPEGRYRPEDFARTYFTHRILRRSDTNFSKLLTDIVGGAVKSAEIEVPGSQDASSSLLGWTRWSSVLSEAETTAGIDSPPTTMIEHHWQGPVMMPGTFFSVLDGIEKRLASLALAYPLFDRNFFVNLKRLELYDIQTNLLIYGRGVHKIRDELLQKQSESDRSLYRRLVAADGPREDFINWCTGELLRKSTSESGSLADYRKQASLLVDGQEGWIYDCMKPWMSKLLSLLRKHPKNREKEVQWNAEFIQSLEKNIDLGRLMDWLGKENFYFQVRVSGFRNGQEDGDFNRMAGQKHGDSDYLSSTIGTVDPELGTGPLKELMNQTGLSSYEVYARYLSEAQ